MKKIILVIDGMTCSACSNGLEKYLNKQNGIESATVNLVLSNALIIYDEKIVDVQKIEEFISKAGFKSLGEFKEIKLDKKERKDIIILVIMSILAFGVYYFSTFSMFKVIKLNIDKVTQGFLVGFISILFLIYGFDILKNGYKNLIHKTPNMDTLVSIGVISSFLYSLYNLYKIYNNQDAEFYFDACIMIIYFLKLGRTIDKYGRNNAKKAIQKLVEITPENAILKNGEKEIQVTLDEIKKDDIIICKPGSKIAVDGKIIYGSAHLDESFITGESKPVQKKVGDSVVAGSINFDGYLEYRAEKIGKDSTISEIVKLVVEANNTKTPIEKLVDKVSSHFVKIVMIIAVIVFLIYIVLGFKTSEALMSFVTVLVVACPCSLGLATPFVIMKNNTACVENGILVKSGAILEEVKKVDTIIFDKTGTLTYGKQKIAKIINYSDLDEIELMQLVGSVENKSSHPISNAFKSYLEEKKLDVLQVQDFQNISGLGISGRLNDKEIILGNSKILEKNNIKNIYTHDEEILALQGNSIVYVIIDKEIKALIGINDIVRDDAKKVISKLNEMNIETIMLTGDNRKTAELIADNLGIKRVISDVVPSQKAQIVKNIKLENKYVMMCGDGINDSPALAIANVGISISSGTEIAKDSSDVMLTQDNLESIIKLLKISQKTVKKIKQNLFWAFFYNTLMIPIATGVLRPIGITITPTIASFAMMISSATVILNSGILFKNAVDDKN